MPNSTTKEIKHALSHKSVLYGLVMRDVHAKFRDSVAGYFWLIFNPLFQLLVFAFVFSAIFGMRSPTINGYTIEFPIFIWSGLLIFNFFAEIVNRSSTALSDNKNLVKKIVIPHLVIPLIPFGSALVNFSIHMLILYLSCWLLGGHFFWIQLIYPALILPYIMFVCGLAWMISAVGAYIRDTKFFIANVVPLFMFLAPIFFDTSQLNGTLKVLLYLNPLTTFIDITRQVFFWNTLPSGEALFISYSIGLLFFYLGIRLFIRLKGGFSDVV